MPTIAVSTYSFGPEAKALEGLDFAVKHGFHGLELGSYTFWPPAIDGSGRRYMRLQSASRGVDLSIHFIHRGIAPASHDQARRARHLQELEATLELARDIGARVVVVHPGPIDCPGVEPAGAPDDVREEALANLADFLRSVVPQAEALGVVVCMENLHHGPGQVVKSYDELLNLVQGVASPAVQITLDTGHAHLSDGLKGAFDTFSPFLRHLHIHDSDGRRDHLEIGQGIVDFGELREVLGSYPFAMALETRNDDDPEGGVLHDRDSLKQLLGDAVR